MILQLNYDTNLLYFDKYKYFISKIYSLSKTLNKYVTLYLNI